MSKMMREDCQFLVRQDIARTGIMVGAEFLNVSVLAPNIFDFRHNNWKINKYLLCSIYWHVLTTFCVVFIFGLFSAFPC